jgi:hypothetical protein
VLHTHANTRAEVCSPAPLSSKVPRKEAPPQVPLWSSCIEKDAPSPEPSRHVSQSPQKRNPPSRFPLQSPYIQTHAPSSERSLLVSESPQSRALFTYLSKPPTKKPPPGSPYGAPAYRKMLHLQNPLCITRKVPRKVTPFQVPLTEPLHKERCSISRAFLTYLTQSPEKKPPCRFPLLSPYIVKGAPSPEPSLHIFKVPRKEAPLQAPISEPHRNRRFVPRTLLYLSLAVPDERGPPLQVPCQGPDGERCSSPGPPIHTSQNSQ